MDQDPSTNFLFLRSVGERVAEGSLPWALGVSVVFSLIALATAFFVRLCFRWLHRHIASLQGRRIHAIRYRGQDLFSEGEITLIVLGILRFVRYGVYLLLLYAYMMFVFGLFPGTRDLASTLLGYFFAAARSMADSTIDFMPSLAFLIVLTWVTRALIRLMRLAFGRVETRRVRFSSFPPEFAQPTFKIVRAFVIIFAIMVAYPYLPGSGSPAFQAVSLFLGVLVSLGSSGAIANIVSGIALTYMRAFKVGDRVKIADAEGDVIERTTFMTKVRTVKNVEITIPNAMVMSNHIINFTRPSEHPLLILHTTITLGYDVDWRRVHEIMIAAALEVERIEADPPPFVLQTKLDDFYVHYELNAHTRSARHMSSTYSELHAKLQDALHEAGIEIASPHLSALRDGNRMAMSESYLPENYEPASFRIWPAGGLRPRMSSGE